MERRLADDAAEESVKNALQALKGRYVFVEKRHVLTWRMWLIAGIIAGIILGIGWIISRT